MRLVNLINRSGKCIAALPPITMYCVMVMRMRVLQIKFSRAVLEHLKVYSYSPEPMAAVGLLLNVSNSMPTMVKGNPHIPTPPPPATTD